MVMVEARVIVLALLNDESNTIVSEPAAVFESSTAWRRLPAPASFVLVTVNVAAAALITKPIRIIRLVAITVVNDLVVVIFGVFRCVDGHQPKAPFLPRTRQKFLGK
jgi:hypothetical protein